MTNTKERKGPIFNIIAGAAFCALAAALFALSASPFQVSDHYSPDAAQITRGESVFDEIPEPEEELSYSAEDYAGLKLYYSAHGKKWHLTRECQYIRNSNNTEYTDYETAVSMGLAPCSKCGFPGMLKD
jgi:hypothetical protein